MKSIAFTHKAAAVQGDPRAPSGKGKQGVFARSLSSYNVIRDKVSHEMQERPGAPEPSGKKKKVEIGL